MKVESFEDTDTLFVELSDTAVAETEEFNENIIVDLDSDGKVVSLTIEHAKFASGNLVASYDTVAA